MKLRYGNIAIMLLAVFTLIGALTNPPLPEDQYNRSSVAQASHASAAAPPQNSMPAVHTAGKSFIPLRGYVEQHNGSLTYNAENATVDITIGAESFSLLLQEGLVMKNGYELNGHFFVQDGTAFISSLTADTLSFPGTITDSISGTP